MSTDNTIGLDAATTDVEDGATASYPTADEQSNIRQAEREARERALGRVSVVEDDDYEPEEPPKSENAKFRNSLAIFLLRLVAGVLVGSRGVLMIFNIEEAVALLEDFSVPYATPIAWVVGLLLAMAGLLLILGLFTRFAAILTASYAIVLLTFLRWGPWNPFTGGMEGFSGALEMLLAGIALALLLFGSGGWGIDHAMRSAKARKNQY